jgi:glucosamine-6-phosphate deaminase
MNTRIYENHEKMSISAANYISEYINSNPDSLLCFAAGDTPQETFARLIEMQKNGKVDLSKAYYVGLDEWWGLGYETKGSCIQVMMDNFYVPAMIPKDRIRIFNGLADSIDEEKRRIADYISEHGGIDLLLLGVGLNGHIGFIEPNQIKPGICIDVPLADTSKAVSVKYFDKELDLQKGITIGIDTVMKAKTVMVLLSGENKAEIAKKTLMEPPTEDVPSSLLRNHKSVTFFLDVQAASLLRNQTEA